MPGGHIFQCMLILRTDDAQIHEIKVWANECFGANAGDDFHRLYVLCISGFSIVRFLNFKKPSRGSFTIRVELQVIRVCLSKRIPRSVDEQIRWEKSVQTIQMSQTRSVPRTRSGNSSYLVAVWPRGPSPSLMLDTNTGTLITTKLY